MHKYYLCCVPQTLSRTIFSETSQYPCVRYNILDLLTTLPLQVFRGFISYQKGKQLNQNFCAGRPSAKKQQKSSTSASFFPNWTSLIIEDNFCRRGLKKTRAVSNFDFEAIFLFEFFQSSSSLRSFFRLWFLFAIL